MQISTNSKAKPRYGFVAVKYFLGIGVIGLVGLACVIASVSLGILQTLWLFLPGIIIGFIGIYIALMYIPLYFIMLRPRRLATLWPEIMAEEGLAGALQVLDVGCGTGGVSIRVAQALPQSKVIGIDIFKGMSGTSPQQPTHNALAEGVGDRVEFREGSLLAIPFPEGTFDLVTAGSVLHEIEGEEGKQAALGEIARVLKPGGKFITVEILRNRRMFGALLIFTFVWKAASYWSSLFEKSPLQLRRVKNLRRFLDLGVFFLQKEPKYN